MAIAAEAGEELLRWDPAETRQRSLAGALRAAKLAAELLAKKELPAQMQALADQLQQDREERARMEAGVQHADEGAQLPPLSGGPCH